MSDNQTEIGKQSSLTDRVKALFSRPNNAPDISKARADEKVLMDRRKFLKLGVGAVGAVVAANTVLPEVVKASGILSGGLKQGGDPAGPVENGEGFPPKGGNKTSDGGTQETREQGELTKHPVNTLQMYPLSQKESETIKSGSVSLESGSPLDVARQKLVDEYQFPKEVPVEVRVAYNPDTQVGGVYLGFNNDQDIQFSNADKPVTFTKDSIMYSGGHYLIEEKGREVVPVVVDKSLQDFFNGVVLENGVVEAPAVGSVIMVARDPGTKEIKTWLSDDVAYNIDSGSVKSAPDAVPTEAAPMAKIESGNGASKGMEYWKSLPEEKLAEIENSASFRFKDYDTLKPLSLSFVEFTKGFSGVKDSTDVRTFPILLEKPSVETIQVTSVSTGKPKSIDVYTAPFLFKTSQGNHVVTEVVFVDTAARISRDSSASGVVGGSTKQDLKAMPVADLVTKMKPGEQYGLKFTIPNTAGGEKRYASEIKAMAGSNWKTEYDEPLDNYVSIMAAYDKNVRGIAPFSTKPGSVHGITGILGSADEILVGPQFS